jgi:peptide chain release factor 1
MEKGMYDNLSSIKDKYGQLEQKINKLSAEGKFSETVEFSKQLSSIEDIVKTFGEYLKCEKSLNDAKEILSNEKDGELIAFAKEEIKE